MKDQIKSLFVVLVIFSISPSISLADEPEPSPCNLNEVIRIPRPVDPSSPQSSTFQYAFQYVRSGDQDLPVVILLPGGPGESSIKLGQSPHNGFDYIRTDPRGVGCNSEVLTGVKYSGFSTPILASDILAIIKNIGRKKYIIHGHSYGSVLATHVTSRANNGEAVYPPLAVVLTGTLGKAFDPENVYLGSQQQWDRIKKGLPSDVVEQLSAKVLPLGLSEDQWGTFIVTTLATSSNLFPIFDLSKLLYSLHTQDPKELSALKELILAVSAPESVVVPKYVNAPIYCGEISQNDNTDMALIGGALVGNRDPDHCKGYPVTTRFDSKNWQIGVPIYYFHGALDNLTPLNQGQYHFANQTMTKRFFATLPEDSHSFILCGGEEKENALWKSIANDGEGFESALLNCPGLPKLNIAKPN